MHLTKPELAERKRIPIEEMEVGAAYEIKGYRLKIGIWTGTRFVGAAYANASTAYTEYEKHWDEDGGTARPLRKLK